MPTASRSDVRQDASTFGVGASLMCAMVALACLSAGWWVIFHARIGPVVANLTTSHGVHSGDVLGLCAVALSLGFAAKTYTSLRQPQRSPALVSTR